VMSAASRNRHMPKAQRHPSNSKITTYCHSNEKRPAVFFRFKPKDQGVLRI
jgi:hypothetical protein